MDSAVKLIEALAKLFGSLAWPLTVAIVVLVVLGRHRGAVDKALDRVEKIVAPGGVEVALREVVKEHEQQVIEQAVQVAEADPEQRDAAVEKLVTEANRHRGLGALLKIIHDVSETKATRQQALDELNAFSQLSRESPEGKRIPVKTIDQFDRLRTSGSRG